MIIKFFMESYYRGGCDTFVSNLINCWPYADDDLMLVCNAEHPGIQEIQKGIKRQCAFTHYTAKTHFAILQGLCGFPVIGIIVKIIGSIARYVGLAYNIFALKNVLLEGSPDRLMIINGGYPGGDCCRAASISWGIFSGNKCPSVHNFHNLSYKPRWFALFQEYIIDYFVGYFSKCFITVSKASANSMKSRPVIYNKNTIIHIYNGINVPMKSDDLDLRTLLGISQNCLICLMLATYEPRKGHSFAIDAFATIAKTRSNVHLVMCGYGFKEEVDFVKKIAADSGVGDKIHILSFRQDVSALLINSDLLLVPSQKFESFGLVSVEAMAHKVPVVATNVGGIPEVLTNGEGGYCVDVNDVDAFAACMIKLIDNKKLRDELGEKGFSRYKELFMAERMSAQYAKIICDEQRL